MVAGAKFSKNDIPFCPTTAKTLPAMIITYKQAKEIYARELRRGNKWFTHLAFVCFYEDDWNFDSVLGIWFRSNHAYKILSHFAGIITPDFSTFQDFPYPLKLWNTPETYGYCFDGLPKHDAVVIGTVGGSPRKKIDRPRFEQGLNEMVRVLNPHTIIVVGSVNYPCFRELQKQGITIIAYPSKTSKAFAGRVKK